MKATALMQFVAAVFVFSCELTLNTNAFQLSHYTKRDISRQFTIGPGDLMHAGLAMDDADSTIGGYVLGLNGSVIVLVQTAVQFLQWQGIGYPDAQVNMGGVNTCSCLEQGVQICFLNCTLEDRDNYISLVNMGSESVQVEISLTDVNEPASTPSTGVTPTSSSAATCSPIVKKRKRTATCTKTRKRGNPRKMKCPKQKKPQSLIASAVYAQTPTPVSTIAVLAEPIPPAPSFTGGNDSIYPSIDFPTQTELALPTNSILPSPTFYADIFDSLNPILQNPTISPVTYESPFAEIPISPTLLVTNPNVPQTDWIPTALIHPTNRPT